MITCGIEEVNFIYLFFSTLPPLRERIEGDAVVPLSRGTVHFREWGSAVHFLLLRLHVELKR